MGKRKIWPPVDLQPVKVLKQKLDVYVIDRYKRANFRGNRFNRQGRSQRAPLERIINKKINVSCYKQTLFCASTGVL